MYRKNKWVYYLIYIDRNNYLTCVKKYYLICFGLKYNSCLCNNQYSSNVTIGNIFCDKMVVLVNLYCILYLQNE